jgi:hypothetical protein
MNDIDIFQKLKMIRAAAEIRDYTSIRLYNSSPEEGEF